MIQIDMEMPASCSECRFTDIDWYYCFAADEEIEEDVFYGRRADFCPLQEVPQEVRIRDDAKIDIKPDDLIIRGAIIMENADAGN